MGDQSHSTAPLVDDGPFNGIPLADSDEIVRTVSPLPWTALSCLQTIQAHCKAIIDEEPERHVADIVGCISQNVLELAKFLKGQQQ